MKIKNAQGLPVNIIVMLIIAIVIFGLGMGLFSKIYKSSDEEVGELSDKIKTGISALECEGDDWICSPNNQINNGGKKDFIIYVANRGEVGGKFNVELNLVRLTDDKNGIINDKCGEMIVLYPNVNLNIESGQSIEIPFRVYANKVSKTPCSFITSATLKNSEDSSFEEKTTIIINVK